MFYTFDITTNGTYAYNEGPADPFRATSTGVVDTGVTAPWAFDGSGNNWVEYPKGVDKEGRALENGLFAGGHTYSCPGDLTGIDAERAIKGGKYTYNVTTKGKAMASANQWTEAEVKANARNTVEGIKSVGGGQVIPIEEVDTTITTKWDAEAAATAVADQVKTFGKVSYGVKGTKSNKKVAYKKAALEKSLNAAFAADIKNTGDHALSLDHVADKDYESNWLIDEASDPMDALIEEETEAEKMAATIAKARAALSVDQWAMVIAKASGKSQKEIAEMTGVSPAAVSLKWKTIVKRATKATGFAFVA